MCRHEVPYEVKVLLPKLVFPGGASVNCGLIPACTTRAYKLFLRNDGPVTADMKITVSCSSLAASAVVHLFDPYAENRAGERIADSSSYSVGNWNQEKVPKSRNPKLLVIITSASNARQGDTFSITLAVRGKYI